MFRLGRVHGKETALLAGIFQAHQQGLPAAVIQAGWLQQKSIFPVQQQGQLLDGGQVAGDRGIQNAKGYQDC